MKKLHTPQRFARGLAGGSLAIVCLLLSGCPGQPASSTLNRGEELLKKMQAAYQRAHSYSDAAELKSETIVNGQVVDTQDATCSVALERANLLRVEAFGTSVVCDGEHLWAVVGDSHLEGQILFLPAPVEMTMKVLYGEPLLERLLGGDETRVRLPQLELLLANQPLTQTFGDDLNTRWLGEKTLPADQSLCHVCEVTGSRGTFVLWVDPNSYVLRRLEITDQKFLPVDLEPGQKITFTIDFTGAEFDRQIGANAFKFEPPSSARLVSHFVLPPQELDYPPSELLGERPGKFQFVDLAGQAVDPASLAGQVVVLDIWQSSCQPCFMGFPNLAKVYQQFRDNDKVKILTVNIDPASESDKALQKAFEKSGLDLPIVRDPQRFCESVFKVRAVPTMILFGIDGTVQVYELGYDPDLAKTLPEKIDQLLEGQSLVEGTLAAFERIRTRFQRELAEATVGVNQQIELPRAKVAAATQPKHLKIEKLWATADVKNPGNLLPYANAVGEPTIALLDGWHTVCQIDAAGETIARHELDLSEGEAITQLRSAVDGHGRRFFAAFGGAQRKTYLLDDAWKIVARYPEETRQGISDVQLADLDDDGQLEAIVGYLGEVGVQIASLAGERLASNRSFENVLSLAVLPRDPDGHRRILVGNERPAIGVLDYQLTQLADIPVADRPIDVIMAANLAAPADVAGDEPSEPAAWKLAALSAVGPAELVALGLDRHGKIVWEYPLPAGVRNTPCEVMVAGRSNLGGAGQWILTGPDGSIHLIAADGQVIDSFYYGEELTGIGTMQVAGYSLLLVATAHELAAWKVTPDGTPAADSPDEEPALTTAGRSERPSLGEAPELKTDTDAKATPPVDEPEEKPVE